ncbi:uncharacterized protein LOC120251458 [Dioscorea cayenensis subsp. rotundata]|uniref:Uncharacterized protein LOC120251458 n=1 Tax=Dioscorea cayennensis subsp. rotundata TaxID=55577 RepID=A0AB40AMC1_DIOCR|nr:uncharacterized protein LOC120251458 [Dioscorea cayenensis subsp. rotundata]
MILKFLCLLALIVFSYGHEAKNITTSSLNTIVRDKALPVLLHRRTGIVYKIPMPMNLSGIEVSGLRLRSKTLRRKGVNIGAVHVPRGAISVPRVKRLIIVYQSLGNWSSILFNVPGHTFVAPVVGFQAYDASNFSSKSTRELEFNVSGDSISIKFITEGMKPELMCASLGLNGAVELYNMVHLSTCYVKTTGYFGVVIPVKLSVWNSVGGGGGLMVWLIACGIGMVGMVVVGLVWMRVFRFARKEKMKEIEDGEALERFRVGGSNMPFATMVRTQPVLETR